MADNELEVKISADSSGVTKELDKIKKETSGLENDLTSFAKKSGIAFAAFVGEIGLSVHAFAESEAATNKLSQAFQTQGIYTKQLVKDYKDIADAVSEKTGLDDDAIVNAQATAQAFLGQTKVSKELTLAIADLAQAKGVDLATAATIVSKSIGTSTNMLSRYGVEVDQSATKQEKLTSIITQLNGRFGGSAEAANKGLGGIKGLATAFGNLQEAIGEKFAPTISAVIAGLTKMINAVKDNKPLLDFGVAFLAAGAAIAGIATVIPALIIGFAALKTALVSFGVAMSATGIGLFVVAIGALVGAVVYLALNWETASARIKTVIEGLVTFVTGSFTGLSKVLQGAFSLDTDKIKAGLDDIKNAFKQGAAEATKELPKATKEAGEAQSVEAKKAADLIHKQEEENQKLLIQRTKATIEIQKMELQNGSKVIIDLKKKEVELLTKAEAEKNNEVKGLLLQQLEENKRAQINAAVEEHDRIKEFADIKAETNAEFYANEMGAATQLGDDRLALIQAQALTQSEVSKNMYAAELTAKVAANNKLIEEQKKYGIAYATINAAINTSEVQGFKSATSELTGMVQSKNATLKAIGKASSIAQITIKGAESAMNVFAGFSVIPIIGPALGAAAAAAVIAFSIENIGKVTAAADGGLITGGIPGKDSVPAMLMPNELVVPARNFDEVVGAVSDRRNPERVIGGESVATVELSMNENIVEFIEARLIQRKNLNISLAGS